MQARWQRAAGERPGVGRSPPVALSVALYELPTWPSGRESVVTVRTLETTVSDRFTLLLCAGVAESFTANARGTALTLVVGVPMI